MNYRIPAASVTTEQIIKKSRFITCIHRAENKQQAKSIIQKVKAQYPDARHHCWAYIAGHPNITTDIACSDDGEPQGTAGKPILNVLQHRNIGEIMLIVVRYFGGIKLGAGGLVRAYSSSAHQAIEQLITTEFTPTSTLKIALHYSMESRVKHFLHAHHVKVIQQHYAEHISLHLEIPTQDMEEIRVALINISAGKIRLF